MQNLKIIKMNKKYTPIIFLLFIVIGCKQENKLSGLNPEKEVLFTRLTMAETGIDFSNELPETIKYNGFQYEYYYNGSGLAVADFNNDGLNDIFFVSALKQHKIFLNQGNMKFLDVSHLSGILYRQRFSGGATIVDINNDGWMDIYVSNSGKYNDGEKRKNKLYINTGAKGENKIPVFSEQSHKYGLDLTDCSTQATFFDYDKDGDLDMFLLNHYPTNYPVDKSLDELLKMDGGVSNNRLLRNDDNYFTDVSQEAGIIHNRLEYGLGVSVGDVNNDGWPDLFICNDYSGKDHLYINNQNGTFSDRIAEATNHTSFFAMGNDMADINNDGWLDMMEVDMMGDNNYDIKTSMSGMNPKSFHEAVDVGLHHQYMYNALHVNSGFLNENNVPIFSDVAQLAGVSKTDWSWGPLFFDMDNDGLKDLFVSNGIKRDFRNNDFVNYVNSKQDSIHENGTFNVKDYLTDIYSKMPSRKKENYFFRNKGNLNFSKMNSIWGDSTLTSSNGAVYADMDNDGDLDLVINNTDDPAFILKNNASELGLGHYLRIKLKGPKNNLDGVGTKVIITTEDQQQMQELYFSRGFMSAMGSDLHFGLGDQTKVTVEAVWPDGKRQIMENVPVDRLIVMNHSDAKSYSSDNSIKTKPYLFEKNKVVGVDHQHQENDFDDFERESLLPHKMSNEGPSLAVGDINGDGLEDMHIGGALGKSGSVYIQNTNGGFTQTNTEVMKNSSAFEDVASEFVDIDNDGDLDLYVVSGGNEHEQGSPFLEDRLYINDGKGNFSHSANVLPKIAISGSCVKAADYDNDGDLDLFVGGRQIPGKYPAPAKSYLLQNNSKGDKISFVEVSGGIGDVWQNLGLVTDALWVDLNNDTYLDLILTGEWMPIRVFENTQGASFVESTDKYGFNDTNGWWYSLAASDFDQDGDIDLVAGNLGLNCKYKASNESPFEVYASDFDNSGTNDIVLGYYDNEKLVPLRGRECSSNQMPFIKKKFPTYNAFAKASITDVFNENQLEKSTHLQAFTFATTYFENKNGSFVPHKMDNAAQFSSVNDILIDDFDMDGHEDLLMVGNLYSFEVETPRNDAGHGLFLKGDGQGNFNPTTPTESGLMLNGDMKLARKISINGTKNIVVAKNNDALEVIQINK